MTSLNARSTVSLRFVLCLLLAALAIAHWPAHKPAAATAFEPTECQMEVPAGAKVECGYITVPATRLANAPSSGKTIRLHAAIIRSKKENATPLIYLSGGPGTSATLELNIWLRSSLIQDYDFILFDQRGTGFSEPILNCPEVEDEYPPVLASVKACYNRLQADGIDLSIFNTVENAADVDALRQALGYDQWDIYALSYGTRLGLILMRDHPAGIRSIILDAVYPPQVNAVEEFSVGIITAFNRLWAACANDSTCNANYPNLEQTFYTAIEKLNAAPVTVRGFYYETGQFITRSVRGDDLIGALFIGLQDNTAIPSIPALLYEFAEGKYANLPMVMSMDGQVVPNKGRPAQTGEGDIFDAEGMRYSVECSEEISFNSRDKTEAAIAQAPAILQAALREIILAEFDTCDVWQVPGAPAQENLPVTSDVRTLILSGTYDPNTPSWWAQDTSKYLPNSFYIEFPGMGHGVIDTSDCANGIMLEFFANPSQKPDTACMAGMVEANFE
jgi:pimeloyl-ACP methyl ester carboxylesterase